MPPAHRVIAGRIVLTALLTGLMIASPEGSIGNALTPTPPRVISSPTYDWHPPPNLAPPLSRELNRRTSRSGPDAAREPVTSGLDVTMETLTPSRLDPDSPVRVTGTITDVEDKDWTNLKVYLVLDQVPVVTPDALETVLVSEPDAVTGDRIAQIGYFDELGDLGAGKSVGYSLQVPFRLLDLDSAAPGVYTVGVHVLADVERVTAGRVRTLMPLMPADTALPAVDLTVMLPLRTPLVREPNGTYADLDGVLEQVAPGGRMRNLLDLAATSGEDGTALLLDPALLDLLLAVVADDFAPPLQEPAPEEDAAGEEPATDTQVPDDGVVSASQQRYAADFLADLRAVTQTVELLVEPYAAADLTAVRQLGSRSQERAIARMGVIALERADLEAEPVLLPVGGLQPDQLVPLARRRTLVLGSEQVQGWDPTDGAGSWLTEGDSDSEAIAGPGDGAPVVVADESLTQGGPEPGDTDSPLQIRQRLLSETAVLSLGTTASDDATSAPGLVHLADADWDPGVGRAGSDLFDALDTAWINPATLSAQLPGDGATRARPADSEELSIEGSANVAEAVVLAARDIRRRATLVQALIGPDLRLLRWYDRAAALTVSSNQRGDAVAAAERADAVAAQLSELLGQVAVEGPEFVTLSSDSGSFPITVTNNLPHPITVGLSLRDSADVLRFDEVPLETIDAGDSAQLNLEVGAPDVGVTAVTATLVTPAGRRFGTPETFNLRSSVVGVVIWVAFGAGGLFLVLLVLRRLRQRIGTTRRRQVAS